MTAPDAAPRDRVPDATLALLAQGYRFGARRTRRHRSDVVVTRLGLRRTTLVVGEEAARLLYDTARFARAGAMPAVVRTTLLGVGGVQGLDGPAHRSRKAMLLSFMGPDRAPEVASAFEQRWHEALPAWGRAGRVVLLDASAQLLCAAVCAWSGVPLPHQDVARRTADLRALVEEVGDRRPWRLGYLRARAARRRAERWCARLVEQTRGGGLVPPASSALAVVAGYRDLDGELLDPRTAAVELLNVLRPTVAIHRWVALAALALELHPRWKDALAATDHDPRSFDEPERFRPERFRDRDVGAFDLVPQGGGDHATGHRCAGEWIDVDVMAAAVRLLTRSTAYDVPAQDLRVAWARMPTAPRSGVMSGVRASAQT